MGKGEAGRGQEQALDKLSGREHITTGTAIMKSAFIRLSGSDPFWRHITVGQGEGCADLVRRATPGHRVAAPAPGPCQHPLGPFTGPDSPLRRRMLALFGRDTEGSMGTAAFDSNSSSSSSSSSGGGGGAGRGEARRQQTQQPRLPGRCEAETNQGSALERAGQTAQCSRVGDTSSP